MNKFAPAALTCKMHDFEAKKPSESIAFLQLFLKPNPYVHNSYSEGVPGSSNSAGTFDVHGMEAESEMARHVHQQAAPWDWSQGQDFHFNGGQRPGLSKELNQGQWWSADRPQVWGPQQIRLVPNHHHLLLNKQLLTTESNKNGFQPPSPEGSRSSVATTQQQGTNETTDKQMRLDVAKAKLLQRYQTEARGQQGDKELPLSVSVSDCTDAQPCANASGETEGSTLHTRSADNIGDSKHEDSRAVHDPTNNGTDPSEIPENGPNSSAPSDDTEDISGNSTAGTSCKNSSCSEEAGNYTELQKGNTQEIHRDSNSYPKKIITYEKSTMNLKTSVTDWRNNTVHEKNLNKESTDSVPSFTEETYASSTYNTLSKKGLSQSPLKIDSAQIPRSIDIPKNEFSNRNSSLHNETETAVTSLGSSDMMTTASLKFDTEVEGNQEADITTEVGVNNGSYPEPQDNYTESSTTKTSNEVSMTGAGRTTPGDVIVTSAEFDAPRDSILSKARINSDSHKMDHSDEIVPHSNVNKSDTISKNAVGNDSFTNPTDKNLDFVAIKTKSRGSRVNFRMENKTVTTGTGKMFRSDIIVSSAESNTFHETNESTGGVNSNANEPGNNSSENPFLSEPVTAETLAREMTTPRESQLTPYSLNTESVATAMPVERSSHVISGEQSRNSNKSKGGEVLSTGSTSGHEISFNGEIKDNFNDSKKYVSERMGHTNESQTSLQSVDASSRPEDFKKSNVSTQDDASTVSSDKRNSATEITPPTEFAEGEASKVSDDVSVTEKGNAQSQKSNRQMKSVRGFPQTDKLHVGYSHGGSFQNSGKNRTGTYTQFQPIAPPNAMQFLVYANAQNPHYVGNGRGSGTLFRMFQQPFIYPPPPPLEHYDHSAGYNSNIRSGNKYDRRRNTGEATNTQAEVNADGRKAEDEFPVSITLGDK
ncbi:hypothetical protein L798_14949 [Zootermopsis nevadensis]|uniref:Uncharacterized protein n=2 Tax=Zootermopsis nevadensis TaxID=136037 RepID=A0A067QYG1_ZOONE|nr:hypothetical protein L798_14949 [Zootermopsis nevadensis]